MSAKVIKARITANKALDLFKDHKMLYGIHSYCSVQKIADKWTNGVGDREPMPPEKHQYLRSVLEGLMRAGVIVKDPLTPNRHHYKLKVDSWDRNEPFRKLPGAMEDEPLEAEADDPLPEEKKYGGDRSKLHQDWKPNPLHTPEQKSDSNFDNVAAVKNAYQRMLDEQRQKYNDLQGKYSDLKEHADIDSKALHAEIKKVTKLEEELKEKQGIVGKIKEIKVKRYDGEKYVLRNRVFPKCFERVKQLAECRRNILLFGPTGSGKTTVAKLLADVLKLPFAFMSLTAGKSEVHITGKSTPNFTTGEEVFHGTEVLDKFENGGVILWDEFDAADPNLLLSINTAIANGMLHIPNRKKKPIAEKHRDCVIIGTANTVGRGATRQYVGRTQPDEATLDRFRIGMIQLDYNEAVEKAICPDEGENIYKRNKSSSDDIKDTTITKLVEMKYGLRGTCQYIRHKIEDAKMRRIMSTRFMEDAWIMMDQGDWDLRVVLEVYFEGWSKEEIAKIV